MPILSRNPPLPAPLPVKTGYRYAPLPLQRNASFLIGVSSSLFARPLRPHVLITPCSTCFAKLSPTPLLSSPSYNIYLEEVALILGVENRSSSATHSGTGDCFHSLGQAPNYHSFI